MLPLITTAYIPVTPPPSLVDTAIPDNSAQRVPYDNAQPPVSSPRTDPDARGNPQFLSPLPAATAAPSAIASLPTEARGFAGAPFGTPATLIAQLMGAPISSETGQLQVILQAYERIVANSQIKYRPSDATKPQVEPAGVFGKLLEQNGAARNAPVQTAKIVEAQAAAASPAAAPRAANGNKRDDEIKLPTIEIDSETGEIAIPEAKVIPAQAIRSYQVSLARNSAIKTATA